MADADAVVTNRNADGTVEAYKLTSSERAVLANDANGGISIVFEAKSAWLQPIVGAERAVRGITDTASRKSTWGYNFVQNSEGRIYKVRKRGSP
jgi:hypothetical protein